MRDFRRLCLLLIVVALLRASAAQEYDVQAFGAAGDGIHDDTQAIQRAIHAVPASGGAVVFPPGTYRITAPLILGDGTLHSKSGKNGVTLRGFGVGATPAESASSSVSRIAWDGVPGGVMLLVNGPIDGLKIEGLVFDCRLGVSAAAVGLQLVHPFKSVFRSLMVTNFTTVGIELTAYSNPAGVVIGANHNLWENVHVYSPADGATGFRIGADTKGFSPHLDVAKNTFINVSVQLLGVNATGIRLRFTDNLTFLHCDVMATAEGSTAVLVEPPAGDARFPAAILFLNSSLMNTVRQSGEWSGGDPLIFWPYPVGDGQRVPSGTFAAGVTTQGEFFGAWKGMPLLYSSTTESLPITGTGRETAFNRSYVVRAGALSTPGTVVRVSAAGRYWTAGSPVITIGVKCNGTMVHSFYLPTAQNASGYGWHVQSEFVLTAVGPLGVFKRTKGLGGMGGIGAGVSPDAGRAAIDTTADQEITINVTWGTPSVGNKIVLDSLTVAVEPPKETS